MTDLRTPAEWCAEYGIAVLDPDGWRGAGGREAEPWEEPVTLAEFAERVWVCTIDTRGAHDGWERLITDSRGVAP